MKTYKVEFSVTPLVEATDEEVKKWIEFELGFASSMPKENPLC